MARARAIRYDAGDWGIGELWVEDGKPVWHELPRPSKSPPNAPQGSPGTPAESLREKDVRVSDGSVSEVVRRIQRYFAGEAVSFSDIRLDLSWCTEFQGAVAGALRGVPYGETVSYGELAALAGYPNAQRAAGTFCAHNRLPLILPCHRVVAASGIGSYGSLGVGYKRRLLELEDAL